MERQSRAFFKVIRLNRLTLLIVGLLLVALATYRFNPIEKVSAIVDRYQHSRVQPGVTLEGQNLGGKTAEELRLHIESLAKRAGSPPREAIVAQNGKGIIPDLNGTEVDVEATVQNILRLPAGSRAQLNLKQIPAGKTLKDFPALAVYQGNPSKRAVSLAINVAWGTEFIPTLISTLEKHGAKATFFVMGKWVQKNPDMLKQIAAAGHEIALHGNNDNFSPGKASKDQVKKDISDASKVVQAVTGPALRIKHYSPHKAEFTPAVGQAAAELGYRTVMYSLDTVDWKDPKPADMVAKILKNAENGEIVLLHPRANTLAALDPILAGLGKNGFRVVTIDELLSPTFERATPVTSTNQTPSQPALNPAPTKKP